jgi:hypothetical protein
MASVKDRSSEKDVPELAELRERVAAVGAKVDALRRHL